MSKIQLVVFDMAGTTVQDKGEVQRCFFAAIQETPLEVSAEAINSMMGWPKKLVFQTLWQQYLGESHPDYLDAVEHSFNKFKQILEAHYQTQSVQPTAGCLPVFQWLKSQAIHMALNTGFYREVTNIILERLGWRQGLDHQYVGAEAAMIQVSVTPSEIYNNEGRPAPFMIQKAMYRYNFSLSLRHDDFKVVGGGGYGAYWHSFRLSLYTAIFGTIIVFIGAYLVEKGKGLTGLRSLSYFLSTLPLALPGLVLGLAYVFFFNNPTWRLPLGIKITNPFAFLYGTMALLVICNITHFYTVCFLTANPALKQLDREFEAVSAAMAVPFYKTFWRVTVPLCLPTILGIGMYFFVKAMVTVSAIIFLYPAKLPLASVAIVNMDDAGDVAAAAAMSTLIVVTSLAVRIFYWGITRPLEKRTQAWLDLP